jgi:DNA polymerase alpha subunit B
MRHSKHWEMHVNSPDVLIIPSKLAPLVTDVFGTLVINPGQLAKGTSGGTFANMTINPIDEMTLRKAMQDNEAQIPHGVSSRTNVAITKI